MRGHSRGERNVARNVGRRPYARERAVLARGARSKRGSASGLEFRYHSYCNSK